MRRFRFYIDDIAEEIVEFEDDATLKDVNEYFKRWVFYAICEMANFEEVEEDKRD